jgi:hypothetical protein
MAKNNDVFVKAKLEQAAELLTTTTKPLSQISSETGFGGEGYTLATKLVSAGIVTEEQLSERRQALHRLNEGKANVTN